MAQGTFIIDIPELAWFQEKWTALPASMKAQIRTTLMRGAISVQGIIREEAPVRTGILRNSFNISIRETTATVSTKSKYGSWVNGGTGLYGAHNERIVPLHAKVLASRTNPGWGSKNAAGYYIIGKSTQGQRANPFMKRAYERSVPVVRAEFQAMIRAITEEAAK